MLQHHGQELASAVALSCAGTGEIGVTPEGIAAGAAGTPILYSHGYKDGLCPFDKGNASFQALKALWNLSETVVLSQDEHHVRTAYSQPNGQQHMETLFWDYESGNWGGLSSLCGIIYKAVGDGHCFPGGSDTKCYSVLHPRVSFPERFLPFSCPAPDTKAAAFVIGEVAVKFFVDNSRKGRREKIV